MMHFDEVPVVLRKNAIKNMEFAVMNTTDGMPVLGNVEQCEKLAEEYAAKHEKQYVLQNE